MCTFYELKSPEMQATTQFFRKKVSVYKQVLTFQRPSKFVCKTSGRQIPGPYWTHCLEPVLNLDSISSDLDL
jgi:hypothetical protein